MTLGDFNLGEIDTYTKKPQGLLLNIGANSYDGPSDGNGNQVVIRLMRARTNGNTAYHSIEIPVCGTRFLYDNGLSVCGFKWKQETSIAPLTVNTMIQSIHFVGDNVVCKGTACPTVGKWTVGDICLQHRYGIEQCHVDIHCKRLASPIKIDELYLEAVLKT